MITARLCERPEGRSRARHPRDRSEEATKLRSDIDSNIRQSASPQRRRLLNVTTPNSPRRHQEDGRIEWRRCTFSTRVLIVGSVNESRPV